MEDLLYYILLVILGILSIGAFILVTACAVALFQAGFIVWAVIAEILAAANMIGTLILIFTK